MDISSAAGGGRRIYGVVIGIVTHNNHPEGLYMVRVKFPWIRDTKDAGDSGDFETAWCRVAVPMAGKERGWMLMPEKDDEVLIAFEHGDPRRPVVIGSLYNGVDTYPRDGLPLADMTVPSTPTGSVDQEIAALGETTDVFDDTTDHNVWRGFASRAGHLLMFHDGKGDKDGKIVLQTKSGHSLVLSDKDGNQCISLFDSTGEEYLHIDQDNKTITIETANGDMNLFCKNGTFTLEAKEIDIKANTGKMVSTSKGDMETSTDANMNAKASGNVKIEGSKIDLNP